MILSGNPASVGMGVSRSAVTLQQTFKRAVREVTKAGGKIAREEHKAAAAAVTGGDGRYSGLGAAGRLTIRVRNDGDVAEVIPKGAWKIAESGAAPHTIKPKKGKALRLADGHIRDTALNHPGTAGSQGKRAWTKAEEATIARLDKTAAAEVDTAVDQAFRRG